MEILLWLAPAAVVTVLAMCWVAWLGREHREHREDREAATRRLGEALSRQPRTTYAAPRLPRERSTGVAVRQRRKAG
ncbi:hypothetical protein [Nocardioides sp.]|uniref:hypothetical protein n=1 Tax=Nocardioides sp. TaxID=35761 RepID=UPI0039E43D14